MSLRRLYEYRAPNELSTLFTLRRRSELGGDPRQNCQPCVLSRSLGLQMLYHRPAAVYVSDVPLLLHVRGAFERKDLRCP